MRLYLVACIFTIFNIVNFYSVAASRCCQFFPCSKFRDLPWKRVGSPGDGGPRARRWNSYRRTGTFLSGNSSLSCCSERRRWRDGDFLFHAASGIYPGAIIPVRNSRKNSRQLFEESCMHSDRQTDKQTDRQTNK